ncbi:unnamed protein product [Rotaria sp. Silwood1]|nr:unnamed protein product [Rotaria sp. Silwood1]CAF3597350.1 unnamed protein product [Rotaria sp. Silwood1]
MWQFCLSHNKHGSILLESCRSLFWLKQKHCYVGYHNDEENEQKFLYTIARFRLKDIIYHLSNFPPITTVPSDMKKYFVFNQNKINSLLIDIDKFLTPLIYRFTQVTSLIICGSVLISLDVFKTIM